MEFDVRRVSCDEFCLLNFFMQECLHCRRKKWFWSRRCGHLCIACTICYSSHVTRHTSHVTPHTSHLTPHTSHLTPHTSHLTPHTLTSRVTGVKSAAAPPHHPLHRPLLRQRRAACELLLLLVLLLAWLLLQLVLLWLLLQLLLLCLLHASCSSFACCCISKL